MFKSTQTRDIIKVVLIRLENSSHIELGFRVEAIVLKPILDMLLVHPYLLTLQMLAPGMQVCRYEGCPNPTPTIDITKLVFI